MKTSEKILSFIKKEGEATPFQITRHVDTSERTVFKQLATLLQEGVIIKVGTPPKVYYKLNTKQEVDMVELRISEKKKSLIEDNFLYITPLGEYHSGVDGFIKWCKDRKHNIQEQAKMYIKLYKEVYKAKKNGVIKATKKFKDTFNELYLKDIFYIDFYSIPQFGKTKLGQLLLYAKQSQDTQRIKQITDTIQEPINKIIEKYAIDAVGFIPPTVKREIQFMKELEQNLNLSLPRIKISKVKTEIVVPQKTLKKIDDRVANAKNTILIEDEREFKNVLLIDDAAGSGATLNETARKIIAKKNAINVYGLSITGSYKGFEVISEV